MSLVLHQSPLVFDSPCLCRHSGFSKMMLVLVFLEALRITLSKTEMGVVGGGGSVP